MGSNYVALNPTRVDKKIGSFSLRLSDGVWRDFATGESGGDPISFYAYINNLSQSNAAQELTDYTRLMQFDRVGRFQPKAPKPPKIDERLTLFIRTIWREAKPLTGTLAERYLNKRGICITSLETLRFHPALWHSPSQQKLPCMVAAISCWPHKTLIGIHRTFLDPNGNGKAIIEPNKMMLGQAKGGAVRLSPVSSDLMIAEGIETALSLLIANPQACVWAALSAGCLKNLVLPPHPFARNIVIAADNDPVGRRAAFEAGNRWVMDGRKVRIALPPEGKDMNDLLQGEIK